MSAREAAIQAVKDHPATTFMAPYESLADAVLAAAEPLIRAQALDQAADLVGARCEEYGVLGVGDLLRRLTVTGPDSTGDGSEKNTDGVPPEAAFTPDDQPLIVYEAAYYAAWTGMIRRGLYTTDEAARAHCREQARLEAEVPPAVTVVWSWRRDDPDPLDPVHLVAQVDGSDDLPTGWTVTPLPVATAYGPEAER